MKVNFKFTALSVVLLLNFSACSTAGTKDCVSCTKKGFAETEPDKTEAIRLKNDLNAPMAMATKGALVITKSEGRAPADDSQMSQADFQFLYCGKFSMIEVNSLASLIKEMEQSPFPFDGYLQPAACQPRDYGADVKAPLLHIIADDASKREGFLNILWLYYTKKRNDPSKFIEAVNSKNTKGETLLDYIESMRKDGMYNNDGLQASVAKIIAVACSHGAIYSAYSDKKCP